ncbi:MAG TPA: class I SAM-dependent methyltransferase, partial [Polyangiaceae bacterium]|nr:class I SAM-dependent methyltransferase [Polyangiaceae bacterium]
VVPHLLPAGVKLEAVRGVRIVTPSAAAMRVPVLGGVLRALELGLADTPAAFFAGFYAAVLRRA